MIALIWIAVLVVALAVLLKGADVFVDQATGLARSLGVPQFLIGVTLVAVGTSLPELAAAIFSVLDGAGEFVAGTVIGSNVANICFIMGTAALAFRGVKVGPELAKADMPVMLLAAVALALTCLDGVFSLGEAIVFLAMYGMYIVYGIRQQKSSKEEKQGKFKPIVILWLALSAAAVYFGAQYTVTAVIRLTAILGLSDTSILALTLVAVGSSLPELVVTLNAAKKKFYDLSLGNVLGSNICNSFLVMGAPGLIAPLPVSQGVLMVGVPFMLGSSLLILVFAQSGNITRLAGGFLLAMFLLFLGKTVGVF